MTILGLVLLLLLAAAGYFIVKGYNEMRRFAEEVKEGFSNISVVTRKKTALINQLITVVGNYAESEKLIMLKLSDDSVQAIQRTTATSGVVLAEIGRMAQRFPELRSNQQYNRLVESIHVCELDVQNTRLNYNQRARQYNTLRSSLPAVLYADAIGFGPAVYLAIEAQELNDAGVQQPMIAEDSERLNKLLSMAGGKAVSTMRQISQQGKERVGKTTLHLDNTAEAAPQPGAEFLETGPDVAPTSGESV